MSFHGILVFVVRIRGLFFLTKGLIGTNSRDLPRADGWGSVSSYAYEFIPTDRSYYMNNSRGSI